MSEPTMALAMPPPGSPTGFGISREERQVERRDALRDDVEEHERQRHEREQHRQAAEHDDDVREHRGGSDRASCGRLGRAAGADARPLCAAPIDQMNSREITLMMSVMMKSTRPISTSACR